MKPRTKTEEIKHLRERLKLIAGLAMSSRRYGYRTQLHAIATIANNTLEPSWKRC
jgi:hypothetical protein